MTVNGMVNILNDFISNNPECAELDFGVLLINGEEVILDFDLPSKIHYDYNSNEITLKPLIEENMVVI